MAINAVDRKEVERYLEKLKLINESGRVNYAENKEAKQKRIDRAKKDYNFFVSYYFPHYADSDCAPFHIEEANKVLKNKHIKAIEEWARGLAKSTHFDIFIPVWLHLFHDELKCMLLVGKNDKSAKLLLSDVQAEFEANPQLLHDFGKLVSTGDWSEGNFSTSIGAAFYSLGKGMSPRGLRNGPHRPDYIVLDDADDDEECRNPMRVDKSVNWVLRALIPCMGSLITRFIMVNNRIGRNTILTRLAENKKFTHRRVNALNDKGVPNWSAKYDIAFYKMQIGIIGLPAFNTEYMNKPEMEGKIFADEYIQYRPRLKYREYQRIVAYWDVAYSERKTADCNAVVIVGLKGVEKHILKTFCRQSNMENVLRWMYAYQASVPNDITVEWYGESQFWNTTVELAIQTVSKEFKFKLPIMFLDRPGRGSNKYSRIIQMVPTFQRREVYFAEEEKFNLDLQEGIDQLKGIEPGYNGHDDFPDALEGAIDKLEVSRAVDDFIPQVGHRNRPRNIF